MHSFILCMTLHRKTIGTCTFIHHSNHGKRKKNLKKKRSTMQVEQRSVPWQWWYVPDLMAGGDEEGGSWRVRERKGTCQSRSGRTTSRRRGAWTFWNKHALSHMIYSSRHVTNTCQIPSHPWLPQPSDPQQLTPSNPELDRAGIEEVHSVQAVVYHELSHTNTKEQTAIDHVN